MVTTCSKQVFGSDDYLHVGYNTKLMQSWAPCYCCYTVCRTCNNDNNVVRNDCQSDDYHWGWLQRGHDHMSPNRYGRYDFGIPGLIWLLQWLPQWTSEFHQISSIFINFHQFSSNFIKFHQISSNFIKLYEISHLESENSATPFSSWAIIEYM